MKIEIRADTAVISGYVNATEKQSKPVITPYGKAVEMIMPKAFERAISRAGDLSVSVDHDESHIYAHTKDGTLQLYEDAIGLHADVVIKDPDLIEIAKKGKIKGWSFGMYNVQDTLEERAGDLPLRKISDLDLDHITLVVRKNPVYCATSIEVRAQGEVSIETRTFEDISAVTQSFDNSKFKERLEKIKKGETI